MIKFNGQNKAVKPTFTVQELFNGLGKPGQVSDYNWFVNDQLIQVNANQKMTQSIKIGSNLRLETIQVQQPQQQSFTMAPPLSQSQQSFTMAPPQQQGFTMAPPQQQGFNIAPPQQQGFNIAPPQQQQQQGFSIAPPQQQQQQGFSIAPPQQQQQQGFNIAPPQQSSNFSICPPQLSGATSMKPIIQNIIQRKVVQKKGDEIIAKIIKDYKLRISEYGDQVTLTKQDDSFQATLYETESSPEITKTISAGLRPTDLLNDEQYIGRLNDTKVMFFRDLKGIVVRWRTGMISKLEFWLEDD